MFSHTAILQIRCRTILLSTTKYLPIYVVVTHVTYYKYHNTAAQMINALQTLCVR